MVQTWTYQLFVTYISGQVGTDHTLNNPNPICPNIKASCKELLKMTLNSAHTWGALPIHSVNTERNRGD